MELRRIEYFVAVAEAGSFTRAADRLHVAQPGVSAQIRQWERELGHELFERTTRSVRLTAVGGAVLPRARAVLAAVAELRSTVAELAEVTTGRVAVGTVVSPVSLALPELLGGFRARYPGVSLSLTEAVGDHLLAELRVGALDVVFGVLPDRVPGLHAHVLVDCPLVAVVRPDDPLPDQASVAALRGREVMCLPRWTGVRTVLEEACARAGFAPDVTVESGNPLMLADLARNGLGVAVLPLPVGEAHPGVRVVRLGEELRTRMGVVWREGRMSPAATAFLDHVMAAFPG